MRAAERAGVSWFIWTLVTSPDIPDGLVQIRRQWSFIDVLEAHAVLEAIRVIRDEEEARRKREAEHG